LEEDVVMRTTYQYKNGNKKVEDGSSSEEQGYSLVETFLSLKKESDTLKESRENAAINGEPDPVSAPSEDAVKPVPETTKSSGSAPKEKKKTNFIPIIAVVILIVGGLAGYKLYQNNKTEKAQYEEEQAKLAHEEELSTAIQNYETLLNSMFTDGTATDVIALSEEDFQLLTSQANELSTTYGEEVSVEGYLNLIECAKQYLSDKEVVESLEDVSSPYDSEKLAEVEGNIEGYTAEGLKATLAERVEALRTEVNTYEDLKTKIQSGDEVTSDELNALTHDQNKQELSKMVALAEAQAVVDKANEELTTAKSVLYGDDGKEKKLSKSEKATAQEGIAKAESTLADAEKKLQNATLELYYIQDSIYGTNTYEEYSNSLTSSSESLED
jgi:hypothetical protein